VVGWGGVWVGGGGVGKFPWCQVWFFFVAGVERGGGFFGGSGFLRKGGGVNHGCLGRTFWAVCRTSKRWFFLKGILQSFLKKGGSSWW